MVKKKILLTFDYELFLGKDSGSVDKCLIEPTDMILELLIKYDLYSIFFVDVTYLIRLKDISQNNASAINDYQRILFQLKRLIANKGYIFFHIHPHWLDAIYDEKTNKWDLSNKSKFSIQNIDDIELEYLFKNSELIFKEIYENSLPNFFGYRAGGLYIQPFSRLKPFFKEYNIKYEFSVLRGAFSEENGFGYNFTECPKENIYKFENDILDKSNEGSFYEFILNQIELKGIQKIINGIVYRINHKLNKNIRIGDGKGSGNVIKSSEKKENYFYSKESFSIEMLNRYKANLYFKELKKTSYLQIISHPKLCSIDSIESFEKFLKKTKNIKNLESNFINMI